MDTPKNHVISILIADDAAAYERLTNLARRRATGLVSIGVATTEEAGFARVTVVVRGTGFEAQALCRHIEKMVDVVEAVRAEDFIAAQMALVRVEATGHAQSSALEIFARYGARLLRQGPAELVAQVTDLPERVEAVLEELAVIGRTTTMRTGLMAMLA